MKYLALIALACVLASHASAQEVVLRLHHFMAPTANTPSLVLKPWAEEIEAASEGRIAIKFFDSMSLGGRPSDLYDQAADGAVDIILTLPGYTPGRFNMGEVFELPFISKDAVATSKAYYDLVTEKLQNDEFSETKVLAAWVHGPGVIHSKEPIKRLEDLHGKSLRGPTRVVTDMLAELGAAPVGMPLPAIPENLSKGVVDGALLPWEITPSIRLTELVGHHSELSGPNAFYTAIFVLAMNWDAYEAMPDDLREILDNHSGKKLSARLGAMQSGGDATGRKAAENNNIYILDETEVARWVEAVEPVYKNWIAKAENKGFDGQALIDRAKALIKANHKE